MLKNFTDLDAWKKAMDLSVKIHELTKSFQKEEMYGITSQLRKAAVSVVANIAEGFGRYTYSDKKHKYVQARGELIEVMTHLYYCQRVEHISVEVLDDILKDCEDIHKLLNALISKMDALNSDQGYSRFNKVPKSEVRGPKS